MIVKRLEVQHMNTDDKLLRRLAYWHNLTPKQWTKAHHVTDEMIAGVVEKLVQMAPSDLYLAVAENHKGEMMGFIWAEKLPDQPSSVLIMSLYVADSYRRKGVATGLKETLEAWCRSEGAKELRTTVHYSNKKMIRLNEKMGYSPGMVIMSKSMG